MTEERDKPRAPLETIPSDVSVTSTTEETVMRRLPAELLAQARRSQPEEGDAADALAPAEADEDAAPLVAAALPEPTAPGPAAPEPAAAREAPSREPEPFVLTRTPAARAPRAPASGAGPRGRPNAARGDAGPRSEPRGSAAGRILLVLCLLAVAGVGAWFWVQPGTAPLRGQSARGATGIPTPTPSPPPLASALPVPAASASGPPPDASAAASSVAAAPPSGALTAPSAPVPARWPRPRRPAPSPDPY